MNEEIPISVGIKSAADANEIAERYQLKARVLKDTSRVGGFKMSQENLKKRVSNNQNNGSFNNFNSSNCKYKLAIEGEQLVS